MSPFSLTNLLCALAVLGQAKQVVMRPLFFLQKGNKTIYL